MDVVEPLVPQPGPTHHVCHAAADDEGVAITVRDRQRLRLREAPRRALRGFAGAGSLCKLRIGDRERDPEPPEEGAPIARG